MRITADHPALLRDLIAERSRELSVEIGGDDRVLWASAATVRLLDPPDGDVEGAPVVDLAHPEDRDALAGAIAHAREEGDVELRVRFAQDGGWGWFDVFLRGGAEATVVALARDVSAHVEEQAALDRILDAIDEHVYVNEVRPDGSRRNVFLGPGRDRLLGGVPEDGDWGRAWVDAIHPEDYHAHIAHTERYLRGEHSQVKYRLIGLDGVVRWMEGGGRPRRVGDTLFVDGIVRDVTESYRREEQLHEALARAGRANEELEAARAEADRLSRVDALTGVFNRRHFLTALTAETERARRDGGDVGVVLLDVDHFKRVNDHHGHHAGDQVLTEVARRLTAALRRYDTVARWGGEEFVVLLPGIADDEELLLAAQRLCDAVKTGPIDVGGLPLAITVSAGAARADLDGDASATIDVADRALYAAKGAGRDHARVAVDDDGAQAIAAGVPDVVRMTEALALAAALREGLPADHSAQVAELAEAVALRLGLDGETVARARTAGWLHDLGKLAIPDDILNKPAKLTDEEWRVMRTHAQLGATVLARIPELQAAAAGVRHHHERLDGAGYPDGLRGSEIPIEARIVAAADAYNAIISHRVYAPARTREEALAELRRAAGTQLDPIVVAALEAVLRGGAAGPR